MHAGRQFFDGEKFLGGPRHDERKSFSRRSGSEAAEHFFAAFVGEEQFPANAAIAIEHRRRGRSDFKAVAIAANVCAAADVALDQAFGFEFGVGVGDGGAMHAEHGGEFAAGGDAVAVTQIAGMDEGAELVAQLDVERNVAFGLEMEWQHCLAP